MKKLVLASLALTCAASVFAQGTVVFGNRFTGQQTQWVYGSKPGAASFSQIGNGNADFPVGTTDWTGFTRVSGSSYLAALMSAPGANAADAALAFSANTTSFRTGTGAGVIAGITATLANVAKDAPVATLQIFAWDNTAGTFTDPTAAWNAWKAGTILGGVSGKFNVNAIGGDFNVPPNTVGGASFNLYSTVSIPEPTTMALAGIGAAALLIFRRRN